MTTTTTEKLEETEAVVGSKELPPVQAEEAQSESAQSSEKSKKELPLPEQSPPELLEQEPSSRVAAEASRSFSTKWTRTIKGIHKPIKRSILVVSHSAATHPKIYIVGVIALSLLLMVVGLYTNFYVEIDEDILWTPFGSRPIQHYNWIDDESGFSKDPGEVSLVIHADGSNILSVEGVERMFEGVDAVRNTPGYENVCIRAEVPNSDGIIPCFVDAPTRFWNDSVEIFRDEIEGDEQALLRAMSADTFPDGTPVDLASDFGKPVVVNGTMLTSAQAYIIELAVESNDDGENFESDALDILSDIRDAWKKNGQPFRMEFFASRSFKDEFSRAIVTDIPLVPIVFIIMSVFTCVVFFKQRDIVRSRTLLGFGAVVSVLLSILSGYGLLFIIGIPFTSMTQILPFVMFGVGLDDAFIISGAYERTDRTKDAVNRIHDTMDEVGVSVFLTTATSALAFGLGCISSIPGVYWLCLYAFPTIIIDFIYQITFFIALVVIDERRVQDNRWDCLICVTAKRDNNSSEEETNNEADTADDGAEQEDNGNNNDHSETEENLLLSYRLMTWYAKQLLRPWVQVIVILGFCGLLIGCSISASRLTQEFSFTDVLPSDSYLTDFIDSLEDYTDRYGFYAAAYFRDVDQSQPAMQEQMEAYVNDLVGLDEIDEDQPSFFWLRDFHSFVNQSKSLHNVTFNDQVAAFLDDPVYQELYSNNIVLNTNGDIVTSRVDIFIGNVDIRDVGDQIDAIKNQRDVSRSQPVNQGRSDWSFFFYDEEFNIWEFYSVAVEELVLTTIIGVVAVSAVGFFLIPHWTAVLFVAPMIIILYVDLLGVLQLGGAHVNAVSYVALVMSIGLLVDFIIHFILRYYEVSGNRVEKTTKTLQTMGASILIGGISTFLGVIPLAFSTTDLFYTIFLAFLGLVTLGIGHGLILLPVVLSLVGPNVCIGHSFANCNQPSTETRH